MAQPRIGRMRDRFGLHGGVDHDPFEIAGRQCAGLVRLLDQPLAPMRQSRAVEWQFVAEAQFTTEELVIGVLRKRAQHFDSTSSDRL